MLGILIMLGAALAVYGIAWVLTWVIGLVVTLPGWLRPVLPWLLFQLYLVVGLFWAGDLPGAPRAVLRLLLIMTGISMLLGTIAYGWRRRSGTVAAPAVPGGLCKWLRPWLLAGTLPWLVALLAEV